MSVLVAIAIIVWVIYELFFNNNSTGVHQMKLAWLCYNTYDSYSEEEQRDYVGDNDVVIKFEKPEDWRYDKIVPIVYAKIEE